LVKKKEEILGVKHFDYSFHIIKVVSPRILQLLVGYDENKV
jgi:hypothetical protein